MALIPRLSSTRRRFDDTADCWLYLDYCRHFGLSLCDSTWKSGGPKDHPPLNKPADLERKKTAAINVPMIANGNIEGYIVAQFVYLADAKNLQELSIPPDDFVTDEAFRQLYSNEIDFNHLEKYDLQSLTKVLIQKINQRLGRDIIKDILVVEFTYVPKHEVSR
jgi:hypothetical protein